MAVGNRSEGSLHAKGFKEGMVLLDLRRPYDFAFIAGKARHAVDIFEPVHFLVRGGKA